MLIPTLVSLFLFTIVVAQARAQPRPDDVNVEALTRGPIHEAFGEPISLNPKAGPIIPKEPPPAVEEMPPDEKPEGDNVAWISGYWQWDDESNDFIWVSGIWRTIPPDRTWVPGYWEKVDNGFRWVGGFWNASTTEIQYQPAPPESLENGPASDPPGQNQIWVPGCWVWREYRYMWRPGFWMTAYPDWTWIPAHYCWTPSGYAFVDGYWDYPLYRRGLVFAPVLFRGRIHNHLVYTPRIVLDLGVLVTSLFVRPSYGHYYFGDYYATTYFRNGYYPWFAYHGSRYGYDPLFAHMDWANTRRDPNWERHLREMYIERRDKPAGRPPHTFTEFQQWVRRPENASKRDLTVARTLADLSKSRDNQIRLQHIDANRKTEFKNHVNEVLKMRDDRVKWEQKIIREAPKTNVAPNRNVTPKQEERVSPPVKVQVPRSQVFKPAPQQQQQRTYKLPELPKQPNAAPHSPGTVRPQTTLPNPDQMIRPDFKRGNGKNNVPKDNDNRKDNRNDNKKDGKKDKDKG
jgi:hypothetical protein